MAFNSDSLSGKDFKRLAELIQTEAGIKMPESKKTMLESRLRKRLNDLNFSTFKKYCDYLFSEEGMKYELIQLLDAVATNKTEFFREIEHFNFLIQKAVPELITSIGAGVKKDMLIWSAGCSTGEEAYTLGMVLNEFKVQYPGLNFNFKILGTDISTKVLKVAKRAVYSFDKSEPVPLNLKKRYLLKSRDRSKDLIRIKPGLRSVVSFRRLNFMDHDFKLREKADIIFFRNVMIYFDKETQERILTRIIGHLTLGGYLFMGHSETLNGLRIPPLKNTAPTIYQKIE